MLICTVIYLNFDLNSYLTSCPMHFIFIISFYGSESSVLKAFFEKIWTRWINFCSLNKQKTYVDLIKNPFSKGYCLPQSRYYLFMDSCANFLEAVGANASIDLFYPWIRVCMRVNHCYCYIAIPCTRLLTYIYLRHFTDCMPLYAFSFFVDNYFYAIIDRFLMSNVHFM